MVKYSTKCTTASLWISPGYNIWTTYTVHIVSPTLSLSSCKWTKLTETLLYALWGHIRKAQLQSGTWFTICTKLWQKNYSEFLELTGVPFLMSRGLYICHCYVHNNLADFLSDILYPLDQETCNTRSILLHQPFTRANAYIPSLICTPLSVTLITAKIDYNTKCVGPMNFI